MPNDGGDSQFYVDEPVMVSFFTGEIGWFCQRFQGYMRYLALEKYKDHKVLFMITPQLHVLVSDFVNWSVDLPKFFYDLNLETDCFESPPPNSPPGSLTHPDVYANLIKHFRKFYNQEKAVEIFPPRGVNAFIDSCPQTFSQYSTDVVHQKDKPIISVYPRGRARSSQRNVPEFVWREVVDRLKQTFFVVLGGTPSGSLLADYPSDDDVLNLIPYNGKDGLEKIMEFCCNSVATISSQSGLSHISLLCKTPSYIIGHEEQRHCKTENRLGTPSSFRYVSDYRAISASTILSDVQEFLNGLNKAGWFNSDSDFGEVIEKDAEALRNIVKERNKDA